MPAEAMASSKSPDNKVSHDNVPGEVFRILGQSALVVCRRDKAPGQPVHLLGQYYALHRRNLEVILLRVT